MDDVKKSLEKLLSSNKIITYKTLAAILNVTISDAKLILKKYMKDQKENKLNVSHVISGITDDDIYKVSVIPETKYDQAKHSFDFITKDYIHAIQKTPLSDSTYALNIEALLYEKDKEEVKSPQFEIENLKNPAETESFSSATNKIEKMPYSQIRSTNNKMTLETESNVDNPERNYANDKENVIHKKRTKSIPLVDDDSEKDTTPEVREVNVSFEPILIRMYKDNDSDVMYQDKVTPENKLKNNVNKEINDNGADENIIRKKRIKSIPLVDDKSKDETTSSKCRKTDILEAFSLNNKCDD